MSLWSKVKSFLKIKISADKNKAEAAPGAYASFIHVIGGKDLYLYCKRFDDIPLSSIARFYYPPDRCLSDFTYHVFQVRKFNLEWKIRRFVFNLKSHTFQCSEWTPWDTQQDMVSMNLQVQEQPVPFRDFQTVDLPYRSERTFVFDKEGGRFKSKLNEFSWRWSELARVSFVTQCEDESEIVQYMYRLELETDRGPQVLFMDCDNTESEYIFEQFSLYGEMDKFGSILTDMRDFCHGSFKSEAVVLWSRPLDIKLTKDYIVDDEILERGLARRDGSCLEWEDLYFETCLPFGYRFAGFEFGYPMFEKPEYDNWPPRDFIAYFGSMNGSESKVEMVEYLKTWQIPGNYKVVLNDEYRLFMKAVGPNITWKLWMDKGIGELRVHFEDPFYRKLAFSRFPDWKGFVPDAVLRFDLGDYEFTEFMWAKKNVRPSPDAIYDGSQVVTFWKKGETFGVCVGIFSYIWTRGDLQELDFFVEKRHVDLGGPHHKLLLLPKEDGKVYFDDVNPERFNFEQLKAFLEIG